MFMSVSYVCKRERERERERERDRSSVMTREVMNFRREISPLGSGRFSVKKANCEVYGWCLG